MVKNKHLSRFIPSVYTHISIYSYCIITYCNNKHLCIYCSNMHTYITYCIHNWHCILSFVTPTISSMVRLKYSEMTIVSLCGLYAHSIFNPSKSFSTVSVIFFNTSSFLVLATTYRKHIVKRCTQNRPKWWTLFTRN